MPVFFVDDPVMSNRVFSVFVIDLPLDQRSPGPSDRRVDRTLGRCDLTANNGKIFPCDLMADRHLGQDTGADQMLGDHSQTGGVPVETVCTPKDERFVLPCIIIHQSICKGIAVIVEGWMDRHPRRLVDDDEIIVLVHNICLLYTSDAADD